MAQLGPQPYDTVPLGQMTDPLSMSDNSISYADQTRFQMISQYQQQMQQYPRSSSQYTRMLSQPRFQYGTNGQDTRFYQRQAEVSRNVYGAGIAKGGADIGSFMGVGAGLTAMGVGGFMGSIVAPMAITAAPLYFINRGVERTLERQRAMQSIASDVEQYRDRIGMSNMSYGQASQLGMNLTSSMFQRGQYFDPTKQQEILKYGLANDMLSGKGRGMVGGDVKTFEKNFKELMETVKQVTKTMKVTAEGAMSVVKEMQMGGFGTMGQIGGAITSAKAFGSMTGLGMQNMLQIGQAGAQAAQGTPYGSASGANMYMAGAAMAGGMARGGNVASQRSVEMAGGVAQAGGILAQFQMNLLNSGAGQRVKASIMDPNMKLNTNALNDLLTGNMSGHNIITKAAVNAHGWGTNRVLFGRRSAELTNQIMEGDPIIAAKLSMATLNGVMSNKRGGLDAQAQAMAMTFGGGSQREQDLIADWIKGPKHFEEMRAQQNVAKAIANQTGPQENIFKKKLYQLTYKDIQHGGMFGNLIDLGSNITLDVQADMRAAGRIGGGLSRRVGNFGKDIIEDTFSGFLGGKKLFNRRDIGSMEDGYKNLYGLNTNTYTADEYKRASKFSAAYKKDLGLMNVGSDLAVKSGWGNAKIDKMSAGEFQTFMELGTTALGNNKAKDIFYNSNFLNTLNASPAQLQQYRNNPGEALYSLLSKGTSRAKGRMTEAAADVNAANDYFKNHAGINLESSNAYYANLRPEEKEAEMNRVMKGPNSERKTNLINIDKYTRAQNDLSKYGIVNNLLPGELVNTQQTLLNLNKEALNQMGMNTSGWRSAFKKGVNSSPIEIAQGLNSFFRSDRKKVWLKNETGLDVDKDPIAALEEVSKRFLKGDYASANTNKQKQIAEALDLPRGMNFAQQAEWWRKQGGDRIKTLSEKSRDVRLLEAFDKKGNLLANEINLKGAGWSEIDAKAARDYVKSGVWGDPSGKQLSVGMANAIAESQGMTGKGVLEMAKKGSLADALYGPSKQLVTSTKINELDKQLEKVLDSSKRSVSWTDSTGKTRTQERSAARDEIMKEKEAIMSLQKVKNPYENSDGKGLGSVVSAPVLNYWNNKWSM